MPPLHTLARKAIKATINLALFPPRRFLEKNPHTLLIDSSVIGFGVFEETYRIYQPGPASPFWGRGSHLANLPIYHPSNDTKIYRQISYLAGLCTLSKSGHLPMYSSAELEAERFRHPKGRFYGYGILDRSLFTNVSMPSIDGYVFHPTETIDGQVERIRKKGCPIFEELQNFFPQRHSLDVWHAATAERHGISVFLTMDFKFRNIWDQACKRRNFPQLNTKILLPDEFSKLLGLQPVHPTFISALDINRSPRITQYAPTGKRQRRR